MFSVVEQGVVVVFEAASPCSSHFPSFHVVGAKDLYDRCEFEGIRMDSKLLVTRVVHGWVIQSNPCSLA
jgi:hypothetical protein